MHLLANSQAALWIGDDASGFVKTVTGIHDLPYLYAIEILFIAIPFLIHSIWGIQYLFTSRSNSQNSDGTTPALAEYPRNHAYTWQRITSWILLVGITAHVIQMRFLEEPSYAQIDTDKYYMVRVGNDPGLYPLAARLGFDLYDATQVQQEKERFATIKDPGITTSDSPQDLVLQQEYHQEGDWIAALEQRPLNDDQVIAVSKSFGLAELLMVRETFKQPLMLILYTLLVISTCFHAFNGLWTFLITWGVTLSVKSQRLARRISTALMLLITFLGLAAIWGTYWVNLKQ
jgi:succinate dehydrogenase / fumarate reductase cytochrome b subunit